METPKDALSLAYWWRRLLAVHGRQAKSAPAWYNGLKTLTQSAIMATIFLVIGSFIFWQIETFLGLPRFAFPFWLAALIFVLGFLIAHWSAWALVAEGDGTPLPVDSTNKLVLVGPYRYIRNPMATASLSQGMAIGLACGSPLILLYVVAGMVAWNYLARPWEEQDLERKFGAEYVRYKQAVRCWIPRLRPYKYK